MVSVFSPCETASDPMTIEYGSFALADAPMATESAAFLSTRDRCPIATDLSAFIGTFANLPTATPPVA